MTQSDIEMLAAIAIVVLVGYYAVIFVAGVIIWFLYRR